MSTLYKVKAYFGMVPLADYEDDYLDDTRAPRAGRAVRGYDDEREPGDAREYGAGRDYAAHEYDVRDYTDAPEPPYAGVSSLRGSGRAPRSTGGGGRTSTRGALAVDSRAELREDARRAPAYDDVPASTITTLRPRDYSEARIIGERFRDGTPVIMDLVEMSNADAKRLVDFAAGLAFALRGSFDKVATKVFLLSPADIDVSAEERRRIVETGFYGQK